MVKGKSHSTLIRAVAGLTLVELMVVLAVAAILVALAVTSLQSLVAANQVVSATDSFATALNEARSEAGKLGVPVAMITTGSASVYWGNGWTMFVDTNGNGTQDVNNTTQPLEATLRQAGKLAPGYTLNSTSSYSGLISFDSTGRLYPPGQPAAEFMVCQNGSLTAGGGARLITVTTSGRVRIVQPDSSGKLYDDNGNQVTSCSP